MRRCVSVLIAVLLLAGLPAAEPAPVQVADPLFARYSELVAAYRAGNGAAVRQITTWPPSDLDRVLAPAAGNGDAFAEAAALLHAEAAVALATTDWPRGSGHLTLAEALVQALPPSAEAFTERFYAFVPTIALLRGDPDGARPAIDRALRLFEYGPHVRTAAGALEELFEHLADLECTAPGCGSGVPGGVVPVRLELAERHYRVALERDPATLEARLRLGRVLALAGKNADAEASLTTVIDTGTVRAQYLAHLFRGAMAVGRGDMAAARAAYEAARTLAPGFQTPYLALSHLEETAGNSTRAQGLIAQMSAGGGAGTLDDPWWAYRNGGLDEEGLQWLRDHVRR